MSTNVYMASQAPLRHGPGPEESPSTAPPDLPARRDKKIVSSSNQDMKSRSTHGKSSSSKHRHNSSKHKSHRDHSGSKKHHKHRHHKSSSTEKDKSLEYTPKERINSAPSSGNRHSQQVPKNKMQKIPEETPTHHHRRSSSSKRANPEFYPDNPSSTRKKKHTKSSTEKKALSKSLPPTQPSIQVPMSRNQRIDTAFHGSLPARLESNAPAPQRDIVEQERITSPPRSGGYEDEPMYPGAYASGSEYSSSYESSEEEGNEDQALSNMENGEGLITAYVVRDEEEDAPSEEQPRPGPPPVVPQSQVMKAPHQINETKQSLNITIPQGSTQVTMQSRAPATSTTVQQSRDDGCCGKGCMIFWIVAFALVGTGCIVFFFVVPVLGWFLLIPGIVFLIASCIFCCCLCSRSGNTHVTTYIAQ